MFSTPLKKLKLKAFIMQELTRSDPAMDWTEALNMGFAAELNF